MHQYWSVSFSFHESFEDTPRVGRGKVQVLGVSGFEVCLCLGGCCVELPSLEDV